MAKDRRKKVLKELNKNLQPLAEEEGTFAEAAPLLFGNGFEKQMKDHVEALKCLRNPQDSRKAVFSKRPPPQPTHTPWGRHEQLPWQRKIQPLPEEGRKRKPEGPVAEAKP